MAMRRRIATFFKENHADRIQALQGGYEIYISDDTFSARDRCLDFHKMEAECKKFNTKALEEAIRKEYENGSLYPQ